MKIDLCWKVPFNNLYSNHIPLCLGKLNIFCYWIQHLWGTLRDHGASVPVFCLLIQLSKQNLLFNINKPSYWMPTSEAILLLQSPTLKLRLYSNKPPHEIAWGSKFHRRADQLQHQNEELAGCTDCWLAGWIVLENTSRLTGPSSCQVTASRKLTLRRSISQ